MSMEAFEEFSAAGFLIEDSGVDSNGQDPYDIHPLTGRGVRELPVSLLTDWDDTVALDSLARFRQTMAYDRGPRPTAPEPDVPEPLAEEDPGLPEHFLRDLMKSVELLSARAVQEPTLPHALEVHTGEQRLRFWIKDQKPDDLTTYALRELSLVTVGVAKQLLEIHPSQQGSSTDFLIKTGSLPPPLGLVPYGDGTLPVWDRRHLKAITETVSADVEAQDTLPIGNKDKEKWRAHAICVGTDTSLFFPEKNESAQTAKNVCNGCPVMVQCLESSIRRGEKFGVWGGTTERQRRRIRRVRSYTPHSPSEPQPSTVIVKDSPEKAAEEIKLPQARTPKDQPQNQSRSLRLEKTKAQTITPFRRIDPLPPSPEVQSLIDQNPALKSLATAFDKMGLEVRDDQLEGVHAIEQALNQEQERILYQMYPGGGKTNMAAVVTDRWLQNNPGKRVLYLCHDTRILTQSRARFQELLGDTYSYGTFAGKEKDWSDPTFMFASFQTMKKKNWQEYFADKEFDFVIVDESHHSKAVTYETVLEHFLPRATHGLAMTGTIHRHDMRDVQEIWGPPVYSKTFADALNEGRLVQPEYYTLENPSEEELLQLAGIDLGQLNRRIFIEERDKQIIATAQEKITAFEVAHDTKAKVLIFDTTIAHADSTARNWPTEAHTLHSSNPHTLDGFKDNEFSTLVAVDMLNEGIDITDVNVIIFLSKTQSESKYIQQLARGLRKRKGKNACLVLDFAGNYQTIMMSTRPSKTVSRGDPSSTAAQGHRATQRPQVISLGTVPFAFQATQVNFFLRAREFDKDPLPTEAMTVERYARERQRDYRTVIKAMRTLHMIPMRPPNTNAYWIPKEYRDELDAKTDMLIKSARPDEYRLSKTAELLGASVGVTTQALEDLGIRPPKRRFGDGQPPGLAISENTLQLLEAAPRIQNYKKTMTAKGTPLGEDEESVAAGARSLGVSKEIFLLALEEELGITKDDLLLRSIPQGRQCAAVKKAHTTWIATSKRIKEAQSDEGALSIHQLAIEHEVTDRMIRRVVKELQIATKIKKTQKAQTELVPPEYHDQIRAHPYLNVSPAPDHIKSIRVVERTLGIRRSELEAMIEACQDVNPIKYKFYSQIALGFTDKDIEALKKEKEIRHQNST